LSLDEHFVVLAKGLVEGLPHGKLLWCQNGGQLIPKLFLQFLGAFGLHLISFEVSLLLGGDIHQLLLEDILLTVGVVLLESHYNVVGVQIQSGWILLSLSLCLIDLLLTLATHIGQGSQWQLLFCCGEFKFLHLTRVALIKVSLVVRLKLIEDLN